MVEQQKKAKPQILTPSEQAVPENQYQHYEPMRMIFLSASVYGRGQHKLTKLTLFHAGKECEAWSNIDFHHLNGFPAFRVENREYMQLLAVYNSRAKDGLVKPLSEAAVDGYPRANRSLNPSSAAFIITEIEPVDQHSRQILADIHQLYRKQKLRLQSAHELRKQNAKLNNAKRINEKPSPPKPITIHFWERDVVKEREEQAANKKNERSAK